MRQKITEVEFILDQSGSMHKLKKDTIGGYNSFLEKQKKEEGDCLISTTLFSTTSKNILFHQDIHSVKDMTKEDYQPHGCTALLDALGNCILEMENHLKKENDDRNIIFVIITDGLENSSREFNYPTIRKMISAKQEEGWKFLFLASNIDAGEEAMNIGIRKDNSVCFHNDAKGIRTNFNGISKAVCLMRKENTFNSEWKKDIQNDFERR